MSLIRHGIVALTGLGPVYGLQLGSEIAARTGRQLNPGQIYSTLARCQRDGLITEVAKTHDNLALFAATPAGLESTAQWFNSVECDWEQMVFQLSLARTLPEQLLPAQQLTDLWSINSMACTLGAPVRVPAGKQALSTSIGPRPGRSRPSTLLTMCMTWL